jgi:hypothetical protein
MSFQKLHLSRVRVVDNRWLSASEKESQELQRKQESLEMNRQAIGRDGLTHADCDNSKKCSCFTGPTYLKFSAPSHPGIGG